MAQPVWVLSVDLQAKTATFQTGMADAAKSARGAFTEIKSGSGEVASHVGSNMFASRHAVMAVSEAFGDTMPRAITALLVHIGPLGAALEAAFPFAAIALGAVLLIEHFEKLKEAGIKLTEDQVRFGTAVQSAFNQLDQRLLQAQIKSDELRNDHLGALRHQLELIDKQSMAELVHSFGEVAKAADVVFADIKNHWYTQGIGATGAKHALEGFQATYASLLAQGKDKEASDLLTGTLKSAERVYELQKLAGSKMFTVDASKDLNLPTIAAGNAAINELKKSGVGWTEDEVKAQQILLGALNAQVEIEGKVAAIKKADSGNATASTGKELAALQAEGARSAAEHRAKMAEIALSGEKAQSEAELSMHEATIAERLAVDERLANEEYRIQITGNQQLIAALDKGGKDYNNQLAGLHQKAEELTAQHTVNLGNLEAKAKEAQHRLDLTNLTQAETEQIEATERGSQARLAAIDAAMREEESKGLELTAFYRDLQKQRVETQRQADAEAAKLAAEAGKESADNALKMGELSLAAARQTQALLDSARRVTIQQRIAEETDAANREYDLKLAAMQAEANALDKGAKDYDNKLRAIQNKELQLVKEHENQLTQIKQSAEIERNQKILAAENQLNDALAQGLTQTLMGHKSFAAMMGSIGSQVADGMMQNAIKSALADDFTKERDAAAAARKAYNIGLNIGGPAGVILGPVFGAAAFASVMAFQKGTDYVPGIGSGDVVPAMLTPGEGVVPGGVMDGLRAMARSGTMASGNQTSVHVAPVYHLQAIDTAGMEKMLTKHKDTIQKHVSNELRKLNR